MSSLNFKEWCRMHADRDYNILIGSIPESDKELFFGPIYEFDKFKVFDENIQFPQLLRDLGLFKSSSDARRNGWNKEIPGGWFEATIGKKKHKLYILKLKGGENE